MNTQITVGEFFQTINRVPDWMLKGSLFQVKVTAGDLNRHRKINMAVAIVVSIFATMIFLTQVKQFMSATGTTSFNSEIKLDAICVLMGVIIFAAIFDWRKQYVTLKQDSYEEFFKIKALLDLEYLPDLFQGSKEEVQEMCSYQLRVMTDCVQHIQDILSFLPKNIPSTKREKLIKNLEETEKYLRKHSKAMKDCGLIKSA